MSTVHQALHLLHRQTARNRECRARFRQVFTLSRASSLETRAGVHYNVAVAIKTRSIVEVQCDLCMEQRTIESDRTGPRLDGLGYRKVKLTIEPIDADLCAGLSWTSTSQIVCRECLTKVKSSLRVQTSEDQTEAELEKMKRALKDKSA